MVFESVPAAVTCLLVLLAILFFIELFVIRILLFCCCSLSIYTCASSSMTDYMRRAASVNRTGSLFKNEPAQQNVPARFQLTSCNSEVISTELTTDWRVGFKMIQNSVPSYKRASSPHVITPLLFH